jgi:hypothetical protein
MRIVTITMDGQQSVIVAWLLEPRETLDSLQRIISEFRVYSPSHGEGAFALAYDAGTGGYALQAPREDYFSVSIGCELLRYVGAVEWYYRIHHKQYDYSLQWCGEMPAVADFIVGTTEPLELLHNGVKQGEINPDRRYRVNTKNIAVRGMYKPSSDFTVVRVRIEPRTASDCPSDCSWAFKDAIMVHSSPLSLNIDWPPLSHTSCERNAVWLQEPTVHPLELLSNMLEDVRTTGPLSIEPADGGVWIRGLYCLDKALRGVLASSRVYEYGARVKIDHRGLGWLVSRVGCVSDMHAFIVAVSNQIGLHGNINLGTFVPGKRYRVPIPSSLTIKGPPNTKICLRVQVCANVCHGVTFANADGALFDCTSGEFSEAESEAESDPPVIL